MLEALLHLPGSVQSLLTTSHLASLPRVMAWLQARSSFSKEGKGHGFQLLFGQGSTYCRKKREKRALNKSSSTPFFRVVLLHDLIRQSFS